MVTPAVLLPTLVFAAPPGSHPPPSSLDAQPGANLAWTVVDLPLEDLPWPEARDLHAPARDLGCLLHNPRTTTTTLATSSTAAATSSVLSGSGHEVGAVAAPVFPASPSSYLYVGLRLARPVGHGVLFGPVQH